jgi:putative acetyltransferase
VVTAAFGREDEARLVAALDEAGDSIVSLVAVEDNAVIGHVLLSRMTAPFPALGLAPLAVHPDHQSRSLGAALVRAALDRAKALGARAVFVLGDPEFYGRFGFGAAHARGFACAYAGPHLMALPLGGSLPIPSGRVAYAPAFADLA